MKVKVAGPERKGIQAHRQTIRGCIHDEDHSLNDDRWRTVDVMSCPVDRVSISSWKVLVFMAAAHACSDITVRC